MKKKRVLIVLPVLILILVLLSLVIRRKHQLARMKAPKKYVTVVQVAPVRKGSIDVSVRYLGEIMPVTESTISSKVSGFIEQVPVDDGDSVKKGELLVRIDDRDIRARISSIESRIEATRSELEALRARIPGLKAAANTSKGIFERNRVLYKNKAIGKEELDISNKNYRLAVSELRATEQNVKALKSRIASLKSEREVQEVLLSYTTITSPFDAVVQHRILSAGDIAVPGKPILTLMRPDAGAKVVIRLAPEDYVRVKKATPAFLFFNGQTMKATVSAVYPGATPESLSVCNILLDKSPFHLPFHTKIEVRLVMGKIRGLVAPISCLLRKGDTNLVIKVDKDNVAHSVPVNLLGKNETHFCFSSPAIKEGDRLASARESRLMRIFTGQKVEVVK